MENTKKINIEKNKNKNEEKKENYESFDVKLEIDKKINNRFVNEENSIKVKIIKQILLKGIEKGSISSTNFNKIEKDLVKIFLSK